MRYGYCRVSTKMQERDGNSLDDQRELICDQYPDAEIVDEAMSGAEDRPKFNKLRASLQNGDTLVVTKLDRFCRTTKEGLEYLDELMSRGVRIHILNMGLIEDGPIGRLIITQLLAFAEFERAMIVERTQAGKARARKEAGYKEGRPRKECAGIADLVEQQQRGVITVQEAASRLGVSVSTWYNRVRVMGVA